MAVGQDSAGRHQGSNTAAGARGPVASRLGMDVPREWWSSATILKAIEAAAFRWVQVSSPPVAMLADPRHALRHASALRRALGVTELRPVIHGPTSLKLGSALQDRAFEGLLEYAHQIGSRHVVYHALDFARRGNETAAEERSLRRLGAIAEALGVTVLVENLCPVYPGSSSLCHDPLSVRGLVQHLDSPAVRMIFDVGHAHVVAGFTGADIRTLLEPVGDVIGAFHVHDNFGARLGGQGGPSIDPLRLDLHLPPGAGSIDWEALRPALLAHEAPLLLEIHAPHRPSLATMWEIAMSVVGGRDCGPAPQASARPLPSPARRDAAHDGRQVPIGG